MLYTSPSGKCRIRDASLLCGSAASAGFSCCRVAMVKDRFGLSWQVYWPRLSDMLMDDDKAKAGRAMQAMLKMRKLDVATLKGPAYAGD